MIELIDKKKSGIPLSPAEIEEFVSGVAHRTLPDYQIAALLMAVCLKGMTDNELTALTLAMAHSGSQIDLTGVPGIPVDKHSTGGVADTTTLLALPIAAACGVKTVKMSGRGLGHTGGTLDKIAAIPGYRTTATPAEINQRLAECGVCLIGASESIAPADKYLYALRDATATVDSLPLIAASIISKKAASGCKALIVDVKTGSGALLPNPEAAKELAKTLCRLGEAAGIRTRALVTDMNQPLGHAIGNALEVREAVSLLSQAKTTRLTRVSLALAAQMIQLAQIESQTSDAMLLAVQAFNDGSALRSLKAIIRSHGGDPTVVDRPDTLTLSPHTLTVTAPRGGYLTRIDTKQLGRVAMNLGAGRSAVDSPIDLGAGLQFTPNLGDCIDNHAPIATLFTSKPETLPQAKQDLLQALTFSDDPPTTIPKTIVGLYS